MGREGFGKLFTLQEALILLLGSGILIPSEKIPVSESLNRILREDIQARIPVPSFAKSAMDGFALIAEDTFRASQSSPVTLTCIGEVVPGRSFSGTIQKGECIEIATGSPLPPGSDAVIMVEHVDKEGANIILYKATAPHENVIEIGSDLKAGTTVLTQGRRISPEHIGVLSAIGSTEVEVSRRPLIAIASSGNELVRPPGPLGDAQIYDINFFTLKAAFENMGCRVHDFGIVSDDPGSLVETIRDMSKESDIVILSGGSSLGTSDYLVSAIESLGEVLVHGIAVKPGKPTIIGKIGTKWIFGLPGHPTSALSNFYIFLKPFIQGYLGQTLSFPSKIQARLTRKIASTIGRYEFLPVHLEKDKEGYVAEPTMKGSSAISSMALSDGFMEIEENVEVVEKGTIVSVTLFA